MTLSRRTGLLAGLLTVTLAVTPALAAGPAAPTPTNPEPPAGSYDEEHLLVAFDVLASASERARAHASQRTEVRNTIRSLNLDVVELEEGDDPVAVAQRYERMGIVDYVDFNHHVWLNTNDTLYKDQWGLHNTGQAVTGSFIRGTSDVDIDAPDGWAAAFPNGIESTGGTLTGIIDTGIDRTHVDLLDRTRVCATANSGIGLIVEGTCSDDNLHGTHVAGTISALTGNGVGVAGVAPNAPLAIFKGLDAAGLGFYADIVAGVEYLDLHEADPRIISMSIGGPQDDALDKALSNAWNNGTLLVAAAGNDGDETPNYPAYHPDVMSVGSIDANGGISSFSNCNDDVEILAPGRAIWSTFPGNSYGSISGTSMATPHVSGVAAMLMSEQGLTASQTRNALTSSAAGSYDCRKKVRSAIGVVNLANALGGSSGGGSEPAPEPTGSGTITGTVTTGNGNGRTAISGALVDCGSGGKTTTGTDGTYTLSSVPVGSYTCTASADGYKPKSGTASVSDGQTTTLDFNLRA